MGAAGAIGAGVAGAGVAGAIGLVVAWTTGTVVTGVGVWTTVGGA